MKKIPDITEQALKKALGELERSIRDTKRESRATDERVAAMDSQRAQLADEVASAHDRCGGEGGREGDCTEFGISSIAFGGVLSFTGSPGANIQMEGSTDVTRET